MNPADDIPSIEALPKPAKMLRKLVCDLLCIGTLGLLILIYYLAGSPYIRGFNCDDESIRYPYKGNTITSFALYMYSFFIPILVVGFNELIILRQFSAYFTGFLNRASFYRIYAWQVYVKLVPFAFAAGSSQLITDIAKYSIGRLRPHFIDLCRPQLKSGVIIDRFSKCDQLESPFGYFDEYTCSNPDFTEHQKRDSHLSFMSGHSSFAAVCLVYTILYIERRVKWRTIGLLKQLSQTLLACLVIFTGLSRISDYKHHWSDVLVGLVQGTTVACLVARYVSDLYRPISFYKCCSQSSSDSGADQSPNSVHAGDREMC